ncbi:MAG: hypothetical protein ACRCUY_05280 [Thermoguttaceae bacterium]
MNTSGVREHGTPRITKHPPTHVGGSPNGITRRTNAGIYAPARNVGSSLQK